MDGLLIKLAPVAPIRFLFFADILQVASILQNVTFYSVPLRPLSTESPPRILPVVSSVRDLHSCPHLCVKHPPPNPYPSLGCRLCPSLGNGGSAAQRPTERREARTTKTISRATANPSSINRQRPCGGVRPLLGAPTLG